MTDSARFTIRTGSPPWAVVVVVGLLVAPQSRASAPEFRAQIAPLLQARCLRCHAGIRPKGGLDLTTRAGLLAGGASGEPALVPGKPAASHLVQLASAGKMPPREPLSATEVDRLRRWVESGAAWDGPALIPPKLVTTERRSGSDWWSLQPIRRPALPTIADRAGVRNPVDLFIRARLEARHLRPAPEAERRTLLRRVTLDLTGLLPTPEEVQAFVNDSVPDAYENIVDRLLASPHYGERWGRHWLDVVRFAESHGYETNALRPNAWPYRDYVIRAFNEDRPFARFVFDQFAGEVASDGDPASEAATGFLVGGTHDMVGNETPEGKRQQRADDLYDMVTTTGSAFLGLTVNCARCHDHKFDPITQQDYYGLEAVFAGVQHAERPLAKRSPAPMVFAGTFAEPDSTHLLSRGDPMQPLEVVPPSAVRAVQPPLVLDVRTPEHERRAALARWIADPRNPLPARVMVNRLWHYHFGQGLVRTPSDFGANGDPPSHPELLDWLAIEYQANGGRLKPLHRLIVCSETYRQSSRPNASAQAIDAGCRLVWHFPSRRLEAEAVHDAMLQVSGSLARRLGGPGYHLWEYSGYVIVFRPKPKLGAAEFRRMIYQFKPRTQQDPTFGAFDCPDATQMMPRRNASTTAIQALNLLNGPFVHDQGEYFASRLRRDTTEPAAQIHRGFLLAFGRAPSPTEQAAALRLIQSHGLSLFCSALFNASEFLVLP